MEELMTLQEVAAYLKMSRQTIYRMAQQSRIPALKVQSRWRFRRSDIESWLIQGNDNAAVHILVVDDDPDIVDLFVHVLQPNGYQVTTALTGQAAIQKVRQQSFELIYLDLVLPDISGPETLRAMRQIDDSARVVVITGNQESDWLQEILELGHFTVLVKPFGVAEIIETAKMFALRRM
jgi:excisionase family DNA binding protein